MSTDTLYSASHLEECTEAHFSIRNDQIVIEPRQVYDQVHRYLVILGTKDSLLKKPNEPYWLDIAPFDKSFCTGCSRTWQLFLVEMEMVLQFRGGCSSQSNFTPSLNICNTLTEVDGRTRLFQQEEINWYTGHQSTKTMPLLLPGRG